MEGKPMGSKVGSCFTDLTGGPKVLEGSVTSEQGCCCCSAQDNRSRISPLLVEKRESKFRSKVELCGSYSTVLS